MCILLLGIKCEIDSIWAQFCDVVFNEMDTYLQYSGDQILVSYIISQTILMTSLIRIFIIKFSIKNHCGKVRCHNLGMIVIVC